MIIANLGKINIKQLPNLYSSRLCSQPVLTTKSSIVLRHRSLEAIRNEPRRLFTNLEAVTRSTRRCASAFTILSNSFITEFEVIFHEKFSFDGHSLRMPDQRTYLANRWLSIRASWVNITIEKDEMSESSLGRERSRE